MSPRSRTLLFTIFAPITVPAYLVAIASSTLLGAAYYIVVEASLARLAGRPLSLSRMQLALFALPVLALAPVATAIHMALWILRSAGRCACSIGRWQVGTRSNSASFALGAAWLLVALWTTVTCFNAAVGRAWIGMPVQGQDEFVYHLTRSRSLGEMPPEMQARRRALIEQLAAGREAVDPKWDFVKRDLEDDEVYFRFFVERRPLIARKLAGLPWFFQPAELSADGLEHSEMLLGPWLLVLFAMIRWPGSFRVLRSAPMRSAGYVLRVVGAAYSVFYLVTWMPTTSYADFAFGDAGPSMAFQVLSPGYWLGLDYFRWVRPEWILFNAALWLLLLGVVFAVWWLAWRIAPFLGWPRYYIAFLASRLLQRKRIAFFSVGAVTLCVAMMIIVISVMGGFVDSIRDRAHGLLGDLVMDGDLQGFPYYEEFIERLGRMRDETTGEPIVVQATPLIHTYGLIQFPTTKRTKAVRIWGIRLDEYVRVNEFGRNLFYQERYGQTQLEPRAQPVWGFDDDVTARLPDAMETHYREYLSRLDPEARARQEKEFRREPGYIYPGPGVFRDGEGELPRPGFEGDPLPGVIIGRDIIARRMPSGDYRRRRDYPLGYKCILTMLPLTRGGNVGTEPPPKPAFRYVDDSRTGIHDIDSMNVYVGFDELQRLLDMGAQERVNDLGETIGRTSPRCNQIQIKFIGRISQDRIALVAARQRVEQAWEQFRDETTADSLEALMLDNVSTQTWEEMQRSYIAAIEKEKFLVLIMFGVISIVAVFLILCIFYMIVQEKTRDIGIMKSVGASAEGVTAVFLAYGAAIGLVGSILGSLLGTGFVDNINEVQDWLARLNPAWRVWSPETYSFDKIPNVWKWSEVIWICVLAIAASVVGAAFPATRAGRTWPVESLRYE